MKEIEAIKQALAAGPTPGEWAHDADCSIVFSNDGDEVAVLERNPTGNYRRQVFFNGEYIAACNPDAMSKVLAHIEAQQAEIEQLRAQRGEPENIDPTGSNLPAEQANTPEVTSQGQVSVPVLWRYRDSEQCIKPMDGYTPGEGWTPLYAAPQPERKPMMDQTAHDMNLVAEKYAHKLALDLECVLADYSGTWYETAMKTLGDYRSAMNAIHERESPTFMGEPLILKDTP
jgi:hypothetical protein